MKLGSLQVSRAGASRHARHFVRRHRISVTLADQALVSGANFLSNIMLARFLGLEGFGRFTLAWMVVLFANSIQYAAIIQPMMAVGPKQGEVEAPAYYGAVVFQQLTAAIVAFVAVGIGVEASALVAPDWGLVGLAAPLAVAQLAGQTQDFFRRYLFVCNRTFFAMISDAIRYCGQLILLYLFAHRSPDGFTVQTALWIMGVAALPGTAYGVFCLGRVAWSPAMLRASIHRHWQVARWLLPSALAYWTTGQAFFMTAGFVLGAATVGLLRAAQAVVGVVHLMLMGMDNFAPAQASRVFHQQGGAALRHYMKTLTWRISILVLVLFLLINMNSRTISQLMYGKELPQLGILLLGFSGAYFLAVLNAILGVWALAIELTQIVFIALIAATGFTAVAAYPMVFFGGAAGVIGGALLAELTRTVIFFRRSAEKFRRHLGEIDAREAAITTGSRAKGRDDETAVRRMPRFRRGREHRMRNGARADKLRPPQAAASYAVADLLSVGADQGSP